MKIIDIQNNENGCQRIEFEDGSIEWRCSKEAIERSKTPEVKENIERILELTKNDFEEDY